MLLQELYDHYDRKWSRIARELGVTESTVTYWRKIGYIPFRSQLVIEKKTKRLFKANEAHAMKQEP